MIFTKVGKIGKQAREELEHFRDLVTRINRIIVEKGKGSEGKVNIGNLDFCLWKALSIARKEIHRPTFHKVWAAHTLCQIAQNQSFTDGNKRTSYVIAKLILHVGKLDFEVAEKTAKDYLIKIAIKKIPFDEVYLWIDKHSKKLERDIPEETQEFVNTLAQLAQEGI